MEDSGPICPQEIVENILSWSQVKTLKKFECVSNTWKTLITSSHFIDSHLSRSKEDTHDIHIMLEEQSQGDEEKLTVLDFDEGQPLHFSVCNGELWGSCNGLLFAMLEAPDDVYMFICNPSTKECRKLPPHISSEFVESECYGFGYNSSTEDYEVVELHSRSQGSQMVQVYSLRNNSWRRVEDLDLPLFSSSEKVGQLVNGKLYWLGQTLVVYDMATEKFKEVPTPMSEISVTHLKALGERYLYFFEEENGLARGWVMKDDESWIKMFEVECTDLSVLFSTKEGKSIILLNNADFIWYDAGNGTLKNQETGINLHKLTGSGCTFTPSLVALGGHSEKMGISELSVEELQPDILKLQDMINLYNV